MRLVTYMSSLVTMRIGDPITQVTTPRIDEGIPELPGEMGADTIQHFRCGWVFEHALKGVPPEFTLRGVVAKRLCARD